MSQSWNQMDWSTFGESKDSGLEQEPAAEERAGSDESCPEETLAAEAAEITADDSEDVPGAVAIIEQPNHQLFAQLDAEVIRSRDDAQKHGEAFAEALTTLGMSLQEIRRTQAYLAEHATYEAYLAARQIDQETARQVVVIVQHLAPADTRQWLARLGRDSTYELARIASVDRSQYEALSTQLQDTSNPAAHALTLRSIATQAIQKVAQEQTNKPPLGELLGVTKQRSSRRRKRAATADVIEVDVRADWVEQQKPADHVEMQPLPPLSVTGGQPSDTIHSDTKLQELVATCSDDALVDLVVALDEALGRRLDSLPEQERLALFARMSDALRDLAWLYEQLADTPGQE